MQAEVLSESDRHGVPQPVGAVQRHAVDLFTHMNPLMSLQGMGLCEAAIWQRVRQTPALVQEESGTTAIEYALMAALMAVACVGAFALFGSALSTLFNQWVVPALAAL